MDKEKLKLNVPYLLRGGVAKDKRGIVSFVNEFNFSGVKRFYVVENCKEGTVRAWHGHRYEEKYVFTVSGKVLIGAVKIDDWNHPSKKAKINSFLMSSGEPAILYIPKGYANGFKSLTGDAKLIFFSTSELEQSKKDDIRFDAKYWNIWD